MRHQVSRLAWLVCFSLALSITGSAQSKAPADPNAKAADAPTSGQAPDAVMKKLSELVNAGKYAEAQQLTAGMLLAFPDDQRLIKANVLLDKSLGNAAATTTTPGSNPAVTNETSTQPAANEKGGLLTGMDKVDYNALIVLARQAQENTDLEQQKASLKQFMDLSSPFVQKHPEEMLLWELRAASALSLDDVEAGYEAGQKLLAAGAVDSKDPSLQQLISKLKLRDWLDKQKVEAQKKQEDLKTRLSWLLGIWNVSLNWKVPYFSALSCNRDREEFVISGLIVEGYGLSNLYGRTAAPDLRGTILDSGEINWESYLPPADPGKFFIYRDWVGWKGGGISAGGPFCVETANPPEGPFYPSGWQPIISSDGMSTSSSSRGFSMKMVIPSQWLNANSKNSLKHPVTLSFTR
jgi:hypothetical protein